MLYYCYYCYYLANVDYFDHIRYVLVYVLMSYISYIPMCAVHGDEDHWRFYVGARGHRPTCLNLAHPHF